MNLVTTMTTTDAFYLVWAIWLLGFAFMLWDEWRVVRLLSHHIYVHWRARHPLPMTGGTIRLYRCPDCKLSPRLCLIPGLHELKVLIECPRCRRGTHAPVLPGHLSAALAAVAEEWQEWVYLDLAARYRYTYYYYRDFEPTGNEP